ncbi:MAG: DUF726 domain-containing protein [Acidimicrobiales bacterium]
MGQPTIVIAVDGDDLRCELAAERAGRLVLSGRVEDAAPDSEGSPELAGNRAIVDNAWALTKLAFLDADPDRREQLGERTLAQRTKLHRNLLVWLIDLAGRPIAGDRSAWCSSCFAHGGHQQVVVPRGWSAVWRCQTCGATTSPCADRRCQHMAVRRQGSRRAPRFCAEHRHEISGFEKAGFQLDSLADYRKVLSFDRRNLARVGRLAGAGALAAAAGVTGGIAAAPAIGGVIGSAVGSYSGAAATSYGLALLGGGSLAAGGLGVAGGTAVVAAVGASLGGALGASIVNAYAREDDSFHVELLRGGVGTPVVVCNGFLTEGDRGWDEWRALIDRRYPDAPVFRVHWGARELGDLGVLAKSASIKRASTGQLRRAAQAATTAGAKRIGRVGPVLLAADLATNPWHVARSRANKTGVIVADLIARTASGSYILVGHSLGARAMVVAAQTLGTAASRTGVGPRLEAVHLLGAAISDEADATTLAEAVSGQVFNYHSHRDLVLKLLYTAAQGGQTAAGLRGFASVMPKVSNVDVSATVGGHSEYFDQVELH